MIDFLYARPSSVAGTITELKKSSKSKIIAGGTNLVDLMKNHVQSPEKLLDINMLPLTKIERGNGVTKIGALVKNSTVAMDPLIIQHLPVLKKALEAGASPQIRNMASVGGNMMQRTRCPYFYDTGMPCNKRNPGSGCAAIKGYNRMHAVLGASDACIAVHPSDMCVALAALNATVKLQGSAGTRSMPFLDFHRLPGATPQLDNNLKADEMILGIEIQDHDRFAARSAYTKVRDRSSYAFALVSVAAMADLDGRTIKDVRLAMGGIAHKPWRLTTAEQYLKGKPATLDHFKEAARLSFAQARSYGANDFKLKLAPNTLIHTLTQICS